MRDLLFWDLMHLHPGFICCRRCLFDNWCICTALIFIVADAFFETDISATYFSLNLQMLFSLPIMYNCICILPYLGFKDTSFAIFASTSHVFDNVRMLLIEILHPQLALSITCGYTSLKFCIFNPPKSIISDISPYYLLSDIHIYYHYIFDTVFINIVDTNCQKMARVVILWYTSIMSRFSYLL